MVYRETSWWWYIVPVFLLIVGGLWWLQPDISQLFKSQISTALPSPIAHWKLDDGGKYSDGTGMVADASGNNKHAILTGDVTWIDGKLGKAIQFPGDSSTNLVLIGAGNTVLRQSSAITYAFWTKFPADGGGYVIGTGAEGGSGYGGIMLTAEEGLQFNWTPLNPGNDTVIKSSGYTFSPDTWYHIAFGINYASTDYRMFVNGEEINKTISNSSVGSFYPIEDYNSGYNDYLGGRYVNQGYYFGGAIDDVKIFNTLISSPAVVKAIAGISSSTTGNTGGASGTVTTTTVSQATNLIAHWKFDEGAGTSGMQITDASGNNNHGKMVSNIAWTDGKFAKALQFQGDSLGFVEVQGGGFTPLKNSSTFSVSIWVKIGSGQKQHFQLFGSGALSDCSTASIHITPTEISLNWYGKDASDLTQGAYAQTFTAPNYASQVGAGWMHVVSTWGLNGTTLIRDIYVNGSKLAAQQIQGPIDSSDQSVFVPGKLVGNCSDFIMLGANARTDISGGALDEVKVFDTALSQTEVSALTILGGPLPTPAPAPVCSDGKIEGTEECDDGNQKDGDGCTKLCKAEIGNICQARTVGTFAVSLSPSWLTEATQDVNKHLIFRNFKIFANRAQEGSSAHIGAQSITGNMSLVPSEIGQGRETLLGPYDNQEERTSQDYKDYMNVKVELVKDGKVTISVSPWQNDPCKNPQCSNTIDDDNDRLVDFSADKGCVDSKDTDETDPISCGNGKVEGGEKCDDGNTKNGDGCDSRCAYEPFCGNGKVENNEECDDGEKNAEAGWCTKECRKNSTTLFVTAKTYKGDLRGIAGADAICQLAADNAGLPTKSKIKTWKAFISDDTQKISDLSLPPPYRLLDGTRVAASKSELFSGKISSPIFRTEEVKDIKEYPDNSGIVWTGSTAAGLLAKDFCKKPTEKTIIQGNVGQATVTDKNWLDYGGKTCEENHSVYCYGIGPAVTLTPPPPPPPPPPEEIGVLPVKNLTVQPNQSLVLPNAVLFDQLTADERKAMMNLYFSPVGAKLIVENNGQEIGSKTASEISIGTFAGPGAAASVKIPNSGIYSFNAEATFIGGKKKIGKFTVTTLRSFALDIRCGKVKLDTKVASCSLYLPKEVIGGKLSLELPKGTIKAIKDVKKSESLPVTAITILKQREEGNVFVLDADFLEITRKVFAKDETYAFLEMVLELNVVEADKIPIALKATLRKGSELYPATP